MASEKEKVRMLASSVIALLVLVAVMIFFANGTTWEKQKLENENRILSARLMIADNSLKNVIDNTDNLNYAYCFKGCVFMNENLRGSNFSRHNETRYREVDGCVARCFQDVYKEDGNATTHNNE